MQKWQISDLLSQSKTIPTAIEQIATDSKEVRSIKSKDSADLLETEGIVVLKEIKVKRITENKVVTAGFDFPESDQLKEITRMTTEAISSWCSGEK